MPKQTGLGRGLGSLIPQSNIKKTTDPRGSSRSDKTLEVSLDDIRTNPRQPRKEFKAHELDDLLQSIKKHGILQPLVVTRIEGGKYELIAGERRMRAARTLGMSDVPIVVRTATEQEKLELALIENIQREDLNVMEEAAAYHGLIDEFNLTQEEVAKRVGKSRSVVANTIRLLELPEEMQKALYSGKITKSHGRTLLAETDKKKQKELFRAILAGGVTVRETEAKVARKKTAKKSSSKDPNIAAHERKLREILGTKVTIQEKAGKGKIIIDFYSKAELADLLDNLSD